MPKLLLKFNAAVIREVPLDKSTLMVGRKPDNDIVIDNPAVSAHHCKILLSGGTYYVEDLDSTNGTFVNEKRIMRAGLRHNDVVGIAKHALVFFDEGAPAAAAAQPGALKAAVLSAEEQERAARAAAAQAQKEAQRTASLRVLKGMVAQPEYELKGLSTYIGKSDRVQVPIKGTGLFGSAPEVAASIHRKSDGYVLVAVKPGYPVVNGQKVEAQTPLKNGDIIEVGATTLQFFLK